MSLMDHDAVCGRMFDLTKHDTPFRTGGLLTVLRDEQITHFHTNLYQGALSLEGFAAAAISIMMAPGQTREGTCAEIDTL